MSSTLVASILPLAASFLPILIVQIIVSEKQSRAMEMMKIVSHPHQRPSFIISICDHDIMDVLIHVIDGNVGTRLLVLHLGLFLRHRAHY